MNREIDSSTNTMALEIYPPSNEAEEQQDVMNEFLDDDILAPNSDTECETLANRLEHIAEIANHIREGGELFLALRGTVTRTHDPWKYPYVVDTHNSAMIAAGVGAANVKVACAYGS
jgi:hypothetical protein